MAWLGDESACGDTPGEAGALTRGRRPTTPRGSRGGSGSRRRTIVRVLLALLAVLVLAVVYQVWTWPRPEQLRTGWPATTAFIERYRSTQRAVRRDDRVGWTVVPYAAIAADLKRAVVVEEDSNFFSHRGFDFGEMRRAVDRAAEAGEAPRGASTITQQLAKNLWLSPSRNPLRKVKEAILTWQLERTLPKRRILELYLNVVEFGPGLYGAEAAARHYFGKSAAALDAREAAQLAATLPRPRRWHPGSPSRAYQAHVERVLRRMAATDWLGRLI